MKVRKATQAELVPAAPREVSPRTQAAARREEELRRALNLAATQPASHVVIVEPEDHERLSTIRSSLVRILAREPRELAWGIRNGAIMIAKDKLPRARAIRR
jgi:hypothetical protein